MKKNKWGGGGIRILFIEARCSAEIPIVLEGLSVSLPLSFLLSFLTFVLSLCRLSKPDRYSRCSRDGFCPPTPPNPPPFHSKRSLPPPPPLLTLPRKRIDRPVSLVLESTGGCFCESTNQPARIRPVRPPPPTPEDFTFTPVLSISGESAEL